MVLLIIGGILALWFSYRLFRVGMDISAPLARLATKLREAACTIIVHRNDAVCAES